MRLSSLCDESERKKCSDHTITGRRFLFRRKRKKKIAVLFFYMDKSDQLILMEDERVLRVKQTTEWR